MQLVYLRLLSISCLREIDKNAEEFGRSPNSSAKGLENGLCPFSLRFCDFRTTKITKSAFVLIFRFVRENKSFPLMFELALANSNAFVG